VNLTRAAWIAMLACASAAGHPMGNFSVSHYTRLEISGQQLRLHYVLDLAEIPTFELMQNLGVAPGISAHELETKIRPQATAWIRSLVVRVSGRQVPCRLEDARVTVSDGAGNMPVLRIDMFASALARPGKLEFEDRNYPDRAGWKELVVNAGKGARIVSTSAGSSDRSSALRSYPSDPAIAPPQMLRAVVEWRPVPVTHHVARREPPALLQLESPRSVPSVSRSAPGMLVRGDRLSGLVARGNLGWDLLLALVIAFGLGAAHALSPGHGKTMVAAYLVGSRGSARHALILGATVTFTHTISVFLLGFVTLFLSRYVLPESLYPVLSAISGLTVAWLGATLLARRLLALRHRQKHHEHGHHHDHDGLGHQHGHEHTHHHHDGRSHSHVPEGDVTMGTLLALGFSGGLVPCPSGLVLLLGSIAVGRVGLGLLLLTSFSAGLALVLTGIGLLVVYARNWLPARPHAANSVIFRWIPVASASVILALGVMMTALAFGWIRPSFVTG